MTISMLAHSGSEPTINDVAEAAGVSIRTVSRVLNKSPKVNAETRKRIEQAIMQLNFRPSMRARALALGRSLLIGMVHNDRNALVLDSVQRGIVGEASARGYELIMHPVPVAGEPAIEDILRFSHRSRVDGLVVLPPVSGLAGLPQALRAENVPVVAISSVPIGGYGAVIRSNERKGAADVARHLVSLGHRRIAMVTGPRNVYSAQERRAGFLEVLAEEGLALAAEAEGDYGLQSGIRAAERFLDLDPRPTAIFAANDIMAAGVLKVAAARKVAVPAQLSVVGFDGSVLAQMLTPSLTTIWRPFDTLGALATRQLLDLIEGRILQEVETAEFRLIEAESSGPAGN